MKIIGIAGGIASGKSAVANRLAELGAGVLDADKAGHEVLRLDAVKASLLSRWGEAVFDDAGEVDRKAVAAIVFGDAPEELAWLEATTHPRIGEKLETELAAMNSAGEPAAVLDAALMFKAGWDRLCHVVLFVDAPPNDRLQRAMARGWTESQFHAREASQLPVAEKKRRSTHVLDNSKSLAELIEQVDQFWAELFDH